MSYAHRRLSEISGRRAGLPQHRRRAGLRRAARAAATRAAGRRGALRRQRAAPYSMKSSGHKRYTVNNNLNATHNLLAAIVESDVDVHVVHLGTMGVYGYGRPA